MESYTKLNPQKSNRLIYYSIPYIILILLNLKTSYFRYVTFCFILLFTIVFLLTQKKVMIKKKYFFLLWFITGYGLLGIIYGDLGQIIRNICMMILNLAPFFIFDWVFSSARKNTRFQNSKILIRVMIPVLIYTVIATLYYLFSNPYIARYMANYDPSMGSTTNLPIAIGGGYVLIYGIILLPPVLLYLGKNVYRKFSMKFFCAMIAIFLLYFVFKAGFATAFIISLTGSITAIVFTKKQKVINRLFVTVAIIIASFVLLHVEIFSETINSITNVLPRDSIVSVRLNEIIPALYGTSSDTTSFYMRLSGLEKTINAFLEYPIFGVGYRVGFDYLAVSTFTGLHTEWLDSLSQYGLLLGVPLLLFIGFSLKELVKLFKGTSVELVIKIVVAMIFVLGFFNPIISTSVFVIAMVFIPCLLLHISESRGKLQ